MKSKFDTFKRTALALSITVLVACGGAEERKSVYFDKAKVSLEAGDYDKARIELQNVLQIDPKDAEAHYQIGLVHQKLNNFRKAYSHFLKAEELDPEHLKTRAALGKMYLLMSDGREKAQANIDYILSRDPGHPDGLLLKASMLLKEKKTEQAIKLSEQILANNEDHVDTVVFLSTLYISKNRFSDAETILNNAVSNNPSNDQLNKLYALTLVNNNKDEEAEQVYKSFIEKYPDNAEGYNLLAAFYHQSDNTAEAEQALRSSIENDPSDADRVLTYIKYIKATKGDSSAITELKGLVEKNSGMGELRLALAELYALSEQKDLAISIYEQAIKEFSDEVTGVQARISLASIYFSDGDIDSAKEVIDDALSVSPNDAKVNLVRARIAIKENDVEQAILALRVVTKETPENIDAFLLLARAYDIEGKDDLKERTLDRAYEVNRLNADALYKLAQYHLSTDINQAEKIIDDFINIRPDDYDGLSIKAAILNRKKSYKEAGEVADILMKSYADKPNGYIQAVPQYTSSSQPDKAESIIEKGYLNTEDNRKLLNLLTSIQIAQKKFDVAENRIQAELKSTPDQPTLLALLANVYSAKGDNNAAVRTLNRIVETSPRIEDSYLLISQVYEKDGRLSDSIAALKNGVSNIPESIKIQIKLATMYEKTGQHTEAVDVYRELYNKAPENMIIANNLASLLSDHGTEDDLVLARSIVDKLKDAEQSVFLDTVGWVYYKSGDFSQALKYLEPAVSQSPDVNVFRYHLGMAYKSQGDTEKAKLHLEKSLEIDGQFNYKEEAEAALSEL